LRGGPEALDEALGATGSGGVVKINRRIGNGGTLPHALGRAYSPRP
jgi:hypothetical protein